MITANDMSKLIDEAEETKDTKIAKKDKKKYSVTLSGGKSDIPADTLDDVLKLVKSVPKKTSVNVIHTGTGKKVAFGPKHIATAVLMALKTKEEK
jgi:hypothetical protein